MKILYVITGLGLGGAERVVINLAEQMYQQGHQVKIAYLTGAVKIKPQLSEIEVIYLGLESFASLLPASLKYRKLVKEYQPDVVHSHMVHANIFTRLNRFFLSIAKLICTAHNSNEGGKVRMLAYKYTNFLSDYNTNVSQEATNAFIKSKAFTDKNIHTVYNGIDLEKFKKNINLNNVFDFHDVNFISVGRFNDQKDYPNLIYAVFQVKQQTTQAVKFYIAGDGELRPQLEQLIKELNLQNDIILLGARSDILELLNEADFFILSSKYEGLPTVVIEAMATQCFVIATDCGGSAEIMGDTGFLVEPQCSEKLAQAILKAIKLPKEYVQENNQNARKRVEKLFSLEKSVQIWLNIYEKN